MIKKLFEFKKENKGMTLVELLVAIAISSVVAGSIAYLLVTSLHMYGNETTDVALQQELQMTINQVMDYAMESKTVVINNVLDPATNKDTETTYFAVGSNSETTPTTLNCEIFWVSDKKLYMMKTQITNYAEVSTPTTQNLDQKVAAKISAAGTDPSQYLLAEYVDRFLVTTDCLFMDGTERKYSNPVSVNISIDFEKQGSTKNITKTVTDKAALRNRITDIIYYNNNPYTVDATNLALSISTETVQNETMLANIYPPGTPGGGTKESFTVLEIVPKADYQIMSYLCGGKEPIDPYGMDALANREIDSETSNVQMGSALNDAKQILNYSEGGLGNLADIPNFVIAQNNYAGYFKKVSYGDMSVRKGKGGVYALDRDYFISNGKFRFLSEYDPAAKKTYQNSWGGSQTYSTGDYCWIWEDWNSELKENKDNGIVSMREDGFYPTLTGSKKDTPALSDIDNASPGARIYMAGCRKYKIVNNEMFILYCLGANTSAGGNYGLVEGITNGQIGYHNDNYNVIKSYAKDKLTFLSCTPETLTNDMVNKADLITFIDPDSGLYKTMAKVACVEYGDTVSYPSSSLAYAGDISFEVMVNIYNRVICNKMSIFTSYTAMNSVNKKAGFANMDNLFYMLYGFDNKDIVSNIESGNPPMTSILGRGATNYYVTQANPLSILDGANNTGSSNPSYLWSGRYMFSDFFPDNLTMFTRTNNPVDKVVHFSGDKKFGTYKISDFVHFGNDGKLYTDNKGYGGEAKKTYTYTFLRDMPIGDYNNPFSGFSNSSYMKFLFPEYYKNAGFAPSRTDNSSRLGVFCNQSMIESNDRIIRFYKNDASGSLAWFNSVISSSKHNKNKTGVVDPIGTVELVGAGVGADFWGGTFPDESRWYEVTEDNKDIYGFSDSDVGRIIMGHPNKTKTVNITYEKSGIHYAHQFENTSDGSRKYIYLNGYEYERAKVGDAGLYVFLLVKSTEDLSVYEAANQNDTQPFLTYWENPSDDRTKKEYHYASGEDGAVLHFKPDGTYNFVALYRVHIPDQYFVAPPWDPVPGAIRFTPPDNNGNNRMVAHYTNGVISDDEPFHIVVRDLFDLD